MPVRVVKYRMSSADGSSVPVSELKGEGGIVEWSRHGPQRPSKAVPAVHFQYVGLSLPQRSYP